MSAGVTDPDLTLDWSLTWEDEVSDDEHIALARLFARAYPHSAATFTGARSWSGARPELRIVGRLDGRPVAHLGVLRRFLHVPALDRSLLVGDVGLAAVDPDHHRRGIGTVLLQRAAATLHALDLPFGFMTPGHWVVPFYRSGGWSLIDGQTTRMIGPDQRVEDFDGPAMVLPVRAPLDDWPVGCRVDRNGLEV